MIFLYMAVPGLMVRQRKPLAGYATYASSALGTLILPSILISHSLHFDHVVRMYAVGTGAKGAAMRERVLVTGDMGNIGKYFVD